VAPLSVEPVDGGGVAGAGIAAAARIQSTRLHPGSPGGREVGSSNLPAPTEESPANARLSSVLGRVSGDAFNETGAARPGRACEPDAGSHIRPSEVAPRCLVHGDQVIPLVDLADRGGGRHNGSQL
jgi:hypothetical protein